MRFRAVLLAAGALAAWSERATLTAKPADGVVERIATLGTSRSVHTTTLLTSGRLLVAGGMNGGSLATSEIVDPVARTVAPAGAMHEARSGHTATLLPNGKVLIAGGYNGSYLNSVEIFDPATNRFTGGGRMREDRSGHTATLMPDGRILIIGGVGDGWTFLSTAELLDPATGRSEAVGSLSVARESHTATLLDDGRVLIAGGHRDRRDNMTVYASAEIYDPTTRTFHPAASMSIARHKHDAVRLADGRVLVLGGADRTDRHFFSSTEIFDPRTSSFSAGPAMNDPRYKFNGTSVRLPSGDVLVGAGSRAPEYFDARAFAFRPVRGAFQTQLLFATANALANGDVVIVGGYGPRVESSPDVWRFRLPAR
ncbi:MAG TPA: kelch repeat-containing protein [Gemmatimonadaceae bacterium]|nr:kelch repeat-containing protein [Gemmatimonadaceae bacterium]